MQNLMRTTYRIVQNCGGENFGESIVSEGEENVGEFTVANSSYF